MGCDEIYGKSNCNCGGAVVEGLARWTSDLEVGGSNLVTAIVLFLNSLDKKLYSTLFLFTQVYKWVPAIMMLGGNLEMD